MVSMAPNQFEIEGIVLSKQADSQLDDFTTVVVQVTKSSQLQGAGAPLDSDSKELDVSMATAVAAPLKKGAMIQCRIRRAPGHFFLIPDSLKMTGDK